MEWLREALIQAHGNQRNHLDWIISGLSNEQMAKRISEE